MPVQLCIFDCDGVLVDSEPISVGLIIEHCMKHGFPISLEDAYLAFLGRPVADYQMIVSEVFDRFIEPIDLLDFQTKILDAFKEHLKPVDGIDAAIRDLAGLKCVASSSNMARISASLKKTDLLHYFGDNLFSTDMVDQGKPHPDVFLHAASAMGVQPRNCIVIEDSPAGIRAAKAAGMRVVGYYGASHGERANLQATLELLSPDHLIGDLSDLKSIVAEATT